MEKWAVRPNNGVHFSQTHWPVNFMYVFCSLIHLPLLYLSMYVVPARSGITILAPNDHNEV